MKITTGIRIFAALTFLLFHQCAFYPTEPRTNNRESLSYSYVKLTNSLMKELEQFRGKRFKRGVAVAVVTSEEYRMQVADQIHEMTAEKRKLLNDVYIRENLLRPGVDYFDGYDTMMETSVAGFYSGGTDTISILIENGSDSISGYDSVVIFHELVHALQDQYFDLNGLQDSTTSSDEYYAINYTIEGEAELLAEYYSYRKAHGSWPSSSVPVVESFALMNQWIEEDVNRLHADGEPLLRILPFWWAYYSYGPLFINEVARGDWTVIDKKIFASPPGKTVEVMYPSLYTTNRKEYRMDMSAFLKTLGTTHEIVDVDELGYMLRCVLLREWNITGWKTVHKAIQADNIIVYREKDGTPLRLIWYTRWDGSNSRAFVDAYSSIVETRRKIRLPAGRSDVNGYTINDTINKVYIEQRDSTVIILEDYLPYHLNNWLEQLHATTGYNPLAKKGEEPHYPRVDKKPIMKNSW